MDIWLEEKDIFDNTELKSIQKLQKSDGYFYQFLGEWTAKSFQTPTDELFVIAKAANKVLGFPVIDVIGFLLYTKDNYRVSHFVGKIDNYDWQSTNADIFHMYICPKLRYTYIPDNMIEKAEQGIEHIWAETYDDEVIFRNALIRRNYSITKRKEVGNRLVEYWYKHIIENKKTGIQ